MKLITALFALALPAAASASIAPDAVLALRVVALARAAGIVADADARAVYKWISEPGRFPDTDAVVAYLDPRRPAPDGAAAPPPLPLLRDFRAATAFVRGLPVSHLGPYPLSLADVSVRFVSSRSRIARFDRVSRCIFISPAADLADLLHEAGHAVRYTPELADYQRVFRDFQGAATPAQTELWQNEMLADSAFGAGILSAARASRSYWSGIAGCIASFTSADEAAPITGRTQKHNNASALFSCSYRESDVVSTGHGPGQPGVPAARPRRSK